MRLDHSAYVPAGRDEVWRFVNDVPAVVDCVAGAELVEVVDEWTYRGLVRIALGPWSLAYQGSLVVIDRDGDLRTLRMEASGRDRRGAQTARASITLTVEPDGPPTRIRGSAEVALRGPVASLTGVARAVSIRLFEDFAREMADALAERSSGRPRPAEGRRDSVQVAPLLWSATRQGAAGYLRRLGGQPRA